MIDSCPECGGEPTDETKKDAKLYFLGYQPDGDTYECSECGHEWSIE